MEEHVKKDNVVIVKRTRWWPIAIIIVIVVVAAIAASLYFRNQVVAPTLKIHKIPAAPIAVDINRVFIDETLNRLKNQMPEDPSIISLIDFTDAQLGGEIAALITGDPAKVSQETYAAFSRLSDKNDEKETKIIKALGTLKGMTEDQIGLLLHTQENSAIDFSKKQLGLIEKGAENQSGVYIRAGMTPQQLKAKYAKLDTTCTGMIQIEEWSNGTRNFKVLGGLEIIGEPNLQKDKTGSWFISATDPSGDIHAGAAVYLVKTKTYRKLWAEVAQQNHAAGLTTNFTQVQQIKFVGYKAPGESSNNGFKGESTFADEAAVQDPS